MIDFVIILQFFAFGVSIVSYFRLFYRLMKVILRRYYPQSLKLM